MGGETATKSYPYQVSMESPSLIGFGGAVWSWQHFCGGSIISNRHVLTAGLVFDQFFFQLFVYALEAQEASHPTLLI